jgi:hypothetical protein
LPKVLFEKEVEQVAGEDRKTFAAGGRVASGLECAAEVERELELLGEPPPGTSSVSRTRTRVRTL